MFDKLKTFYNNHPVGVMIGALILATNWTWKSFTAVTAAYHSSSYSWRSYAIVLVAVLIDIYAFRKARSVKAQADARAPVRRLRAIIRHAVRQRRRLSATLTG